MEEIKIYNYEAYYLDYLEGNLSDDEVVLLVNFLAKNPDLKLDDESIINLEKTDNQLGIEIKENLKQVDYELDKITKINVSSFLIAQLEGELSSTKNKELELFLTINPNFKTEQLQFNLVRFQQDSMIQYPHKEELKQKEDRKIGTLFTTLAIAASLILLFTLSVFNSSEKLNHKPIYSSKNIQTKENKKFKTTIEKIEGTIVNKKSHGFQRNYITKISEKQKVKLENEIVAQSIEIEIQKDESKSAQRTDLISDAIPITNEDKNYLDKIVLKSNAYNESKSCEKTDFKSMDNPIKMITAGISDLINKDVDFRRCKSEETGKSSFYLKIGKFVISKQTS